MKRITFFIRCYYTCALILIIATLGSCKSRYIDDQVPITQLNKGGYIVDTISLDDPIRLFYFSGDQYLPLLVEKERLNSIGNLPFKKILNDPYLLIFSTSFYSLFPESSLKVECFCQYTNIAPPDLKDHEAADFDEPNISFLLALVNINYFHLNDISLEEKLIPSDQFKSAYVKVAFPMCEK